MLRRIAVALVSMYLLAGFILLPYLIRHELPAMLLAQSGVQLEIGSAAFNPITFELSLSHVSVAVPGQEPLLRLNMLRINLELYALLGGVVRFKEILLEAPHLLIKKDEKGVFNFASLQKNDKANAAPNSDSGSLPAIIIDTLEIQEGSVAFFDHSKSIPFDVKLAPLGLRLKDIDTRSGEGMIRLFSHINDGGFIDIRSRLASVEPLVIDGSVEFRSGRLFTGWRYLREMIGIEIADGALYAGSHFHFDANAMEKTQFSSMSIQLERLRIKPQTRYEDILRLGSMRLSDGTMTPFLQQGHFERLEINDVMLHARRLSEGTLDWQHYLAQPVSGKTVPENNETTENTPSWDVTLDTFALTGLHIGIDDEAMMPVQHFQLNDFNLSAENIHSLGGYPLSYTMASRFNETFTCKSQGTLEHSLLKGSGMLACHDLDLTWFNPYIDKAAKSALDRFDVALKDAKASWILPYRVEQNSTQISLMLSQAALTLENFDLRSAKEAKPMAGFKAFTIDGVTLDSGKKEAYIEHVVLEHPQLHAAKGKEGRIDWNRLIQPKVGAQPHAATDDATPPLWNFRVNAIDLKQGSLLWRDASIATPARLQIDPLEIAIRDFRSDAGHPFGIDASLHLNRKSAFAFAATMQREPLQVDSNVSIVSLQLPEANPYLAETLNLYLGRGSVDMQAKMHYAPGQKQPEMTLKGNLAVRDVLVNESLNDALLMGFDKVEAAPFTLQLAPDALLIESLGIHALYTDIHIDANKSLNLSRLQKKSTPLPSGGNDSNASSASAFPVTIVKLDFKEGVTDFRDDSLPLKFKTHVHNVNGSVYGISTQRDVTSYLNFNGDIDAYGAMKVDGSLRAGDPGSFTDIGVTFRNIALPDMSPYSANFAGRKIDEGKLFLDLKYKIVDSRIQGDNSIVIKKIKLGEAVEGESSLPLGLAVALLEDADGVIDIDMPVAGDMNNPDFKYGALVMNTLKNLILKVVSAPFSFLGSMLGIDGDSLKTIAYEAGRFELLPPEREKLDLLAKALEKRPKLALQISGAYDAATDTRALQIAKLEALVLERSGDKGGEAMQDPEFLEKLYVEFNGEVAYKALSDHLHQEYEENKAYEKALQDALIEGVIVRQEVAVAELEFLARSRAVAVKEYLMQNQKIDSSRVTLGGNILAEADNEGFINAAMEIVPMQ